MSQYKDLQIETEKMWHLKTTILPVISGALSMIKNEINTIKKYLAIPTDIKYKKIHFVELLISR